MSTANSQNTLKMAICSQIFAIDTCSHLQIMSKNGQIMMCFNVFSFIFEHVKHVSDRKNE